MRKYIFNWAQGEIHIFKKKDKFKNGLLCNNTEIHFTNTVGPIEFGGFESAKKGFQDMNVLKEGESISPCKNCKKKYEEKRTLRERFNDEQQRIS